MHIDSLKTTVAIKGVPYPEDTPFPAFPSLVEPGILPGTHLLWWRSISYLIALAWVSSTVWKAERISVANSKHWDELGRIECRAFVR